MKEKARRKTKLNGKDVITERAEQEDLTGVFANT